MLSLLLTAVLTADAAPTPVEPAWILVDAHAALYEAPREDAPRLRVAVPEGAPGHRPPPVLVLLRVAREGDFLQVHTAHHGWAAAPDGRPAAPDAAPFDSPHCYPQAAALAQLDAVLWVRASDVRPVLTRPVRLDAPDGTEVDLAAGLLVDTSAARPRVVAHHLTLVAALPDDAVGDSYEIGLPPPASPAFVGLDERGSFVLQPTWRPRVTLDVPGARVEGALAGGGRTVGTLRDRCVDVRLATPVAGAPPRGAEPLRPATTWPVLVPEGTLFGHRGEPPLGRVAGGPAVIWRREACDWSPEAGLCCDPMPGFAVEGHPAPALCFDADHPTAALDQSLDHVLEVRAATMSARSEAAARVEAELTWATPVVHGSVAPDDVDEALQGELPRLRICYQRALQEDPWLAGTLRVRLPLAADGRARPMTVTGGDVGDPVLRDCLGLRLQGLVVPDQIGQPASVADLAFTFRPLPRP